MTCYDYIMLYCRTFLGCFFKIMLQSLKLFLNCSYIMNTFATVFAHFKSVEYRNTVYELQCFL